MHYTLSETRIASWLIPLVAIAGASISSVSTATAAEPTPTALGNEYQSEIRPLMETYCHDCHGAADEVEGDINLAAMKTWDDAVKHPPTWQKVSEMLGNGLMPPEDGEQPTSAERARLQKWVGDYLVLAAKAHAGDPGRVVLRRLNNAEYTYTLRDLTGVESLDPAREFPADGAAGEGFTNTGNALVMSPALVTKYFDAAKEVASHAELLPDGFRFSPHTTARDWTNDLLAQIRSFYGQFTDAGGGSQVNLQGIVFKTNQGGRLPVEKYLAATLIEREAITTGRKSIEAAAREHHLNAKYLGILWTSLNGKEPSLLLDGLRVRWQKATPEDAPALAEYIATWQKSLWSFSSVGLIGRVGGPKGWMEPVSPVTTKQEFKFKLPESVDGSDVTVSLVATDAGDGNASDFVVWHAPRLASPGQPDLLLRDVRRVAGSLQLRRTELFASAAACLNAADEIASDADKPEIAKVARKYDVQEADLQAWLNYLGIGAGDAIELEGLFTNRLTKVGDFAFVNGWGSSDTPLVVTNSSNEHVRIPGNMEPHSVAVHPSPTLRAAIGWQSPIAADVHIEGSVTHAHPECGNGVTWSLELRRGATRQRLAGGMAQGATAATFGPFDNIPVHPGDLIVLSIGSRDGNHSCDLTASKLEITCDHDGNHQVWNLAKDVSGDILAGNPHADSFGNARVWQFFTEPDGAAATGPVIPANSLLAKWQIATSSEARRTIASELQKLLTGGPLAKQDSPDAALFRQLASMRGPLLGGFVQQASKIAATDSQDSSIGIDPSMFGHDPNGRLIEPADLCVQAPSVVEVHLPADLVSGCDLVSSAELDKQIGAEGSAQLEIVAGKPALTSGLLHGETTVTMKKGRWSDNNKEVASSTPILVAEGSAAQRRIQAAFDAFRQLFPPALCYVKIVPVDEAISVTLFYREDDHLQRLMLDESQKGQLDRMWDELHFVSRDALKSVDAFAQLLEFATQDADPKAFEPMRKPINDRAAACRQLLVDSEPKQFKALLDFASLAYRRPLTSEETTALNALYTQLRKEGLPHEEAFRLTLARILVGSAFLYRIEKPVAGAGPGPISDWELASRLSYFLWSSAPDAELRQAATDGRLHEPEVLAAQTQRMLRDAKTRRLATEFACHWLHIDDFEHLDEKSERHFPSFANLRGAMAEESTLFFTDLFQHNGSVLDILNADYTFLNGPLAKHYGIPGVTGAEWRRVDGVKKFARGGILAQATTLSKQSGASRTSPILRGNWVSEVLLGERLPKPPKGVPPLPDDEAATKGLTVRQLVEKHVSDPKCSVCHQRFDAYGFSLEAFDAIGRHRDKDLGGRPIDTHVTTMDGATFDGVAGLRHYLLTKRRDAFVRQFCRKLLGYALGRAVQLTDGPLLTDMEHDLAAKNYKVDVAIDAIVQSRQFREIRGMKTAFND